MSASVNKRVKALIEETNDAFLYCRGSLNADYAEFATLSLSDFKNALRNPNLTPQQLMTMLRKASAKHRKAADESCWSSFMAQYVARGGMNNSKGRVSR